MHILKYFTFNVSLHTHVEHDFFFFFFFFFWESALFDCMIAI